MIVWQLTLVFLYLGYLGERKALCCSFSADGGSKLLQYSALVTARLKPPQNPALLGPPLSWLLWSPWLSILHTAGQLPRLWPSEVSQHAYAFCGGASLPSLKAWQYLSASLGGSWKKTELIKTQYSSKAASACREALSETVFQFWI